jgi:hypothetical protein
LICNTYLHVHLTQEGATYGPQATSGFQGHFFT